MLNWKHYFVLQVFVLLSIKVSNIQSGCSWQNASPTSHEYCSIACTSKNYFSPENVDKIMPALNQEWDKRPDCHVDGIDLKLENLKYSELIFKSNLFTTQVKVRELSVNLKHDLGLSVLKMIEIDAFNVVAFKLLKKLVIKNINFTPIKKGILNGLESLEVLNIKGVQLRVIEAGLLAMLNESLNAFSLEEESSLISSPAISIDGLTGSVAMKKLENVKFRYDLNTSIARNTLVGIPNVKLLDLSNCKIESIEAGAFDSLKFLEILKLEDNYLTVIPDGFFYTILIRNMTQISLKGNRFHCNCDLMPFKMSLMEYSNFVGQPECYSEPKYNSHKIIDTDFCDTTTVVPTSTTSTSSPSQVCISEISEVVSIDPPVHKMQIFVKGNDDVVLRVDELQNNSVLIWSSLNDEMTSLDASEDINCLIGTGTSFRIANLTKDSIYTFCIMNAMEATVSPLDCISYIKKSDSVKELPWLYDKNKTHFVAIAFIACGFNTLLGLAMGILTNKLKIWSRYQKEPFIRSYQSSRASSMRRSRLSMMTSDSYMTRRTTNTTVQYYLNGNFEPPPLPARPVSMYLLDEPVYATIRDFASISATSQTTDNL